MFKKTQKMLAIIIMMFLLMATTCFATEVTPVTTAENPDESAVTTSDVDSSADDESDVDSTVDETTLSQDLYEDDLYQFGDEISVANLIDGNAYLMGQNVTISGKVGGDVFVFADTFTLTGDSQIYGNLFVCANKVVLEGIVCDLYVAGGDLSLSETGIVLRDMRTATSSITLNGSVGRNTHITANSITVGEAAHIYGDFNYSSKEAIQVPSGSVDGSINYTEASATDATNNTVLSYVMNFVYALVYTLVVFGIMVLLAPNFLRNLKDVVAKKSLVAIAIGLGVLILPLPLALLFLFSVIGTPVAFALIAVWAFLVFGLTFAVTAIALGTFIGSKVAVLGKAHNLLGIILMTLVLWGLLQVPFFIGTVIQIAIWIFGLGYLFVTAFANRKKVEA